MRLSVGGCILKFADLLPRKYLKPLILFVVGIILFSQFVLFLEDRKAVEKGVLDLSPQRSSLNDGSSGTSAFRELLVRMGYSDGSLMESLRFAKTPGEDDLLLIIAPHEMEKMKQIESRARKGTWIFFYTAQERLMDDVIVGLDEVDEEEEEMEDEKSYNPWLRNVSSATAFVTMRYLPTQIKVTLPEMKRFKNIPDGWSVFLRDSAGVLAIHKYIGDGRIVLVSDSAFLSNFHLRDFDNAVLATRMLGDVKDISRIFFNEYAHGYQKRLTLLYFLGKQEPRHLLLVGFFLLLSVVYSHMIRFGRIPPSDSPGLDRVYFYSEGLANLLTPGRFCREIFDMMVNNRNRMKVVRPGIIDPKKQGITDAFVESLQGERIGKRDIRKLANLIKEEKRS